MEEDEILGKAYDSKLMKRLLLYLKPYRWHVVLAIILAVLVSSIGPLRPYITKIIIDDYIVVKNYQGMLPFIILLFVTIFLQAILQYILNYFTQWIGQKTIYNMRMQVFTHLQNLALKFFDNNPVGRLVTRVTSDVEVLNEMFSSGVVMVFSDVFTIIFIVSYMFIMDVELSLVTLCVIPILVYSTFIFRKKVREAYREVRKYVANMNSFLNENITGMNTVQLFNREEKSLSDFKKINALHRDANIKSIFYYAVYFPLVDFTSALAIALIIWYGGGNVIRGYLTFGVLISFIQYTEMFFRPIRDLSEKYNILQTAMASSERVFKLLDDKTIISVKENPIPITNVKGDIEFKNVCFAYNGEDYILKNVSFKIKQGETIAFVGATGAGKTSIISLLTRFYDIEKGEILIDGINIKDYDPKELRKHMAVVLQDVFIFSGDIKFNIDLGDESISLNKINEAISIVGLDDFINSLPEGLFSEVKERGATLSVGQKQLISFARALVRDPKILILDEATSNVDTESERLIQNAINKLLKNRTSIVIAHRLSTIQNADKIIVLHHGEIRETGTHQELLSKGGIYYKLYQLQYKQQESVK
ncbi:MAG TPA: ABC transporter ATP-binding protein [Bacteroidota bacterium]|jgi:ATP-binding cassette subfamily B protein|nr:ABC transporter ATP-binding protein [Bacteroidota bacterium]